MKLLILILITLASLTLISCSNNMSNSNENSVQYNSKGYHIPFEVRIDVTGNELDLYYKGSEMENEFKETYKISDDENENIFEYLNEIKFLEMEVPELEKKMDAPVSKLIATLNGESREINIGQMSNIPQSLIELRNKLYNLASEYKPGWKKEVGFE